MKYLYGIAVILLCLSCSSNSDDNDPNTSNYSFYIIADVDGQTFESGIDVDAISNADPYGLANGLQPTYNEATCVDMSYEAGLFPFGDESLGAMGVGFDRVLSEFGIICNEELDNFDDLFTVGSYAFAQNDSEFGVKVDYSPSIDGMDYYESYGAQDSSAYFEVTSVEPVDCGFNECVIITGTFSCRLYNVFDPTDILEIENGIFKLSLRSWNP